MKITRPNTFETNSSSTHAITIPKKIDKSLLEGIRPSITFHFGEYGWEYKKYDLKDYIWTAICENYPNQLEEYKEKIKGILSPYYKKIEFDEAKYEIYGENKYLGSECGYIDHGYELKDFIDTLFENEDLFVNAILDGYVRTGNDNADGYDLDELDDDPDYYHYYKGN